MVAVEPLVTVPGRHVGGEGLAVAHVLVAVVVVEVPAMVVVVSSVVSVPPAWVEGCVTVQYRLQQGIRRSGCP